MVTGPPLEPNPIPRLTGTAGPSVRPVFGGLLGAVLDGQGPFASSDNAWSQALAALGRASSPDALCAVDGVPALYVYVAEDPYAASRALILSDLWGTTPMGGALVSCPDESHLLVLLLNQTSDLHSLPVLLGAHRVAVRDTASPALDALLWTDGRHWESVEIRSDADGHHLSPGPRLRAALASLSQLDWTAGAAAQG